MLDRGWEDFKVACEYDGDQHRTDRGRYVKDVRVYRKLEQMGWITIRVIKDDREQDIISRVDEALRRRGYRRDRR